jgi:hypothetical protein
MKQAIVTLVIGDEYRRRWEQISKKGWTAYCQRHGYDLIPIDRPLDESERAKKRSPAWQKCLVLEPSIASAYEQVVWLDGDILINPAAPPITAPLEKIGAINEHAFPSPADRLSIVRRLITGAPLEGIANRSYWEAWLDPGDWHAFYGLPKKSGMQIVQTGVLVLSPKHHREILRYVYDHYDDRGSAEYNYEMRPLSYEIQNQGIQYWIDPKFNALTSWLVWQSNLKAGRQPNPQEFYCFLLDQYLRNHFLHFAGMGGAMDMLRFLGE